MSLELLIIILILAIPTYFFCKWVITRFKIGKSQNRKLITIISTAILSPMIYVAIFMIWVFSVSYYPSNDFDQNEWNIKVGSRYEMSEDIIESNMLIGKTSEEVIQILGNDVLSKNEKRISYYLGFVPGLISIDPDYLDIRLENGIVISVNQYQG